MKIYNFDELGIFTGKIKEIGDKDGCPKSWTRTQIDFEIPAGKFAQYDCSKWFLRGDYPVKPEQVPQKISMRRARLILLDKGLLASIQSAIDSLPEPDKTAAQIEWDYSAEVWRNKQFVLSIAQGLGWSDEFLDNLFIDAMDSKYD